MAGLRKPVEVIDDLMEKLQSLRTDLTSQGPNPAWKDEMGPKVGEIRRLQMEAPELPKVIEKLAVEVSITTSRLPKGPLHNAPCNEDVLAELMK